LLFFILFVFAVFPAVVYAAYYVAKKTKSAYISVDEWGKVRTI
jgi:hypothetical protein